MTNELDKLLEVSLPEETRRALEEDLRGGDLSAQLIPAGQIAEAQVITREPALLCGRPWVEETFRQIDASCRIEWEYAEGTRVGANALLFRVYGPARSLLTAERTALNFLQFLSGTATLTAEAVAKIAHTPCRLLDTRKTIPGLRYAQKYAVRTGGGQNHRLGLWDAFLIKENHIAACGSIDAAIRTAKSMQTGRIVEIEVETAAQLQEALAAGPDVIMLDNFSVKEMHEAVALRDAHAAKNAAKNGPAGSGQRIALEASGGIDAGTLATIAETGVDYISSGSLTKHCRAIDLSMRLRPR